MMRSESDIDAMIEASRIRHKPPDMNLQDEEKLKEFEGRKFGQLTALYFAYRKNGNQYWQFKCSCGRLLVISKPRVTSGSKRYCGHTCPNKLQQMEADFVPTPHKEYMGFI